MLPRSEASVQRDLDYGAQLRDDTESALARGDDVEAEELLYIQQQEAFRANLQVAMEGGDPISDTTPAAALVDPEVEYRRRQLAIAKQELMIDEALGYSEEWKELKRFKKDTMEQWRQRNQEPLAYMRHGLSPEEQMRVNEQFQPIQVDPDLLAEMRQRLAQANARIRDINPRLNVFNHPKTKDIADFVATSAEGTFLGEAERPYDYAAGLRDYMPEFAAQYYGRMGHVAKSFLEGVGSFSYAAVEATSALALNAMDHITGGHAGDYWSIPTHAVVDNTGEIIHNAGKVHPDIGVQLQLWTKLLDHEAQEALQDASAWEKANRHGMQWLVSGVAHLGGSIYGLAPAMKVWHVGAKGGSHVAKGLARLAGGKTDRVQKIASVVGGLSGTAIGGAMTDGYAYGKHEGIATAAAHGAIVAPLLTVLGAGGGWLEKALVRKKMPPRLARVAAGATEGAGFGVMETAQIGHLWEFLKDPSESTWKEFGAIMLKNMLGLGAMKGAMPGRLPHERLGEEVAREIHFTETVKQMAKEAATTKDPARRQEILELAKAEGVEPRDVMKLGELVARQESAVGKAPQEAGRARKQAEAAQREMRTKREGLAEQPTERIEARLREREYAERYGKEAAKPLSPKEAEYAERYLTMRTEVPKGMPMRATPRELAMARRREGEEALPSSRDLGVREAMEGVPGTEPVRYSDVTTALEGRPARKGLMGIGKREADPVQMTTRRKGFKEQGIEGYLDTRDDLVRLNPKEVKELNVLAHEWAHQMQKSMVGLELPAIESLLSPQARRELLEIGSPMYAPQSSMKTKIAEGWAELFARDLLGDVNLAKEAPSAYRELMNWVASNPALAGQYGRIKDVYTRWREQGALAARRGMIEPGRRGKKTKIQREQEEGFVERIESALGALVDDASAFRRSYRKWMELAGKDPDAPPPSINPVKLYDAFKGTVGHVAQNMIAGTGIGKVRAIRDSLKLLDKGEVADFWDYMVSRRELEMIEKGQKTTLSKEENLFVVDRLHSEKFEAVAKDVTNWFNALTDYVAEMGGLSMEQATRIKDGYEIYVPFLRVREEGYRPFTGRGQPIQPGLRGMRGGGEGPIKDPMEVISDMTVSLVARAQKAAVMRAMYDQHMVMEGIGGFVTDVTRDVIGRDVTVSELGSALKQAGSKLNPRVREQLESSIDVIKNLAEGNFEAVTLFSQSSVPRGMNQIAHTINHTPEQMTRLRELKAEQLELEGYSGETLRTKLTEFDAQLKADQGKVRFLEVDKDAYGLLTGVDAMGTGVENLPRMVQALLAPFTLTVRAVRGGAVTVDLGFRLKNALRDALQQAEFSQHGSLVPLSGFKRFLDGIRTEREVTELVTELGGGSASRAQVELLETRTAVGRAISGLLKKLDRYSEQPIRLKEFQDAKKAALEKGYTEFEANMEALLAHKEVSVNFTRGSAFTRAVGRFIPFFNAGAQGTRKFTRRVLGHEGAAAQKQALLAGMINIGGMSALSHLFFGEEDWFRDLPEWRKMNFISFKGFDDEVMHLPLPFEMGKMFHIPISVMHGMVADESPELRSTLTDFMFEMGKSYLNNYTFLPAALGPVTENIANYSFFKEREIVPDWMERERLPKDQYTKYTSQMAKWIGEAINVSPLKVENAIAGYTGGAGMDLIRSAGSLDHFLKRYLTGGLISPEMQQGRSVDEMYKLANLIRQAKGSDAMTPAQKKISPAIDAAKAQLNSIRKQVAAQRITKTEADQRSFQIARKVLDRYSKMEGTR